MAEPTTNNQLPTTKRLKVALVCDWLTGIGGAERVVLELHKMYPDAPIYTSQYEPQKIGWFKDADVRTGWLQKLPSSLKKFLPVLRARYFSHLDLSDYDLVISSSGAEAKAVKTSSLKIADSRWQRIKQLLFRRKATTNYKLPTTKAMHIAYVHSPTHYYWSRYDDYMKSPGFGALDPLARLGLRLLVGPMRRWDYKAAQRPAYLIANSNFTKEQIKKYYGRDSIVIHPPVDIERFETRNKKQETRRGFLAAGRQTPYKRIDLAVGACTELNLPLTVIGDGPDHNKLVKMAGPTITFLTGLSDQEVVKHFQSAAAFIFPGVDDFGIVAVEALAAGTPVIAYQAGGALDYIVPGKNGLFFDKQTVDSLSQALKSFSDQKFNEVQVSNSAVRFSIDNFHKNIREFISSHMEEA